MVPACPVSELVGGATKEIKHLVSTAATRCLLDATQLRNDYLINDCDLL